MTDKNRKWYTVQTYSGYENKVKADLDQRITSMGMENKIFRVLVPTEERIIVKDGKTRRVSHKLFPSYVLVEMILDDQSWYVVRHTPGVTNFVGVGNRPLTVSQSEIDEILVKIGEKAAPAAPEVKITCKTGDHVRVVSGAFVGSEGPVTEIIPARGKVKFSTVVFGHETEIEVDFAELEMVLYQIGDHVSVASGNYAGSQGYVTAVMPARNKAKLKADISGRETEIEVDFAELKKL